MSRTNLGTAVSIEAVVCAGFGQPLRATGAHCRAAAARPVPERLRASTKIREYPAWDRIAQCLMTVCSVARYTTPLWASGRECHLT